MCCIQQHRERNDSVLRGTFPWDALDGFFFSNLNSKKGAHIVASRNASNAVCPWHAVTKAGTARVAPHSCPHEAVVGPVTGSGRCGVWSVLRGW